MTCNSDENYENVLSTFVLYEIDLWPIGQPDIHCSSKWHKNTLARVVANGEPISTLYFCLYYFPSKMEGMSKMLNRNAKFEMLQLDHDKKLNYVLN